MEEYILVLFWFCRSKTTPWQYIHCIYYSNKDTNFKRIFSDHFSAGLAAYGNGIFWKKIHQHKTPTHLCLFDLHYAVRSTSTLKQTCKIKQELTVQLSLFSACVLDYQTRQARQRGKKSTAIKVFSLFDLRVKVSTFQWSSLKHTQFPNNITIGILI